MSEKQLRLLYGGAFKRCGKVFCSVHGDELNEDGSCSQCLAAEQIAASEIIEAEAMRKAQEAIEEDV